MSYQSEEHSSYVVIPHEFAAVRVFSGRMVPIDIELKVSCSPMEASSIEEIEQLAAKGFERLKFWYEVILQDVVLANASELPVLEYDNSLLHTPGNPTDHLLTVLLHSKVSHILEGFFDVYEVSISTSDTEGIETHFRNVDGYHLPDISYFPEESIHDIPWWERDTLEVCELRKVDVGNQRVFNQFSDFFGDDASVDSEADIIMFENE